MYPQNILGDEHPQFGLARNSWLSGTAAWMYVTGTQYILGIRPTFDGLRIDPCIPEQWKGLRATRRFRHAVYEITVSNPNHLSKGVRRMNVDGKVVQGNVAPLFGDNAVHPVQIVME